MVRLWVHNKHGVMLEPSASPPQDQNLNDSHAWLHSTNSERGNTQLPRSDMKVLPMLESSCLQVNLDSCRRAYK